MDKKRAWVLLLFLSVLLTTPEIGYSASADDGFNPNANSYVYSTAVQADGKVIVGGGFTSIGGQTRNHIARLNSDGAADAAFNPDLPIASTVHSIAVQADGKIIVGGYFTLIGGQTRNHIARLSANGTVDATFDPNSSSTVYSIAVQADGKIIVGGYFTLIGGQTRNRIARLSADDAALQNLTVSRNGRTIAWMRGQSSPEVWRVTFEDSPDGITWSSLGNGTRITGGWELTGLSLPLNQNHYVRARGYATGGYLNASGSLFESVRIFKLYKRDEIVGTGGAWSPGIWYYNLATDSWLKAYNSTPSGPIAAGDVTGDGWADVISCWPNGLWYQDGVTLGWTKVYATVPSKLAVGDITGD